MRDCDPLAYLPNLEPQIVDAYSYSRCYGWLFLGSKLLAMAAKLGLASSFLLT